MSTVRDSPSGKLIDATGGGDVTSVFGRDGDVTADNADYVTSLVDNASSLPGSTLNDVLDLLGSSSGRLNESTVPGATVTDALNYLLTNMGSVPLGTIIETFSGGAVGPVSAPTGDDRLGDNKWSIQIIGDFPINTFAEKVTDSADSVGVLRLRAATDSVGGQGVLQIILGPPSTNEVPRGIIMFSDIADLTWRVAVDPTKVDTTVRFGIGSNGEDAQGGSQNTSFAFFPSGGDASPNWKAWTNKNGFLDFADTGVPADAAFHDFRIERLDASTVRYFIDGVLVVTANPITVPDDVLMTPFASASLIPLSTLDPGFADLDGFELNPVS